MRKELAAIFPSFTRVPFTGRVPIKTQSRNGAPPPKYLKSRRSGVFALSLVRKTNTHHT